MFTAERVSCMKQIRLYIFISAAVIGLIFTGWDLSAAQSGNRAKTEEWNIHRPGGETRCADGSEFRYYTREGDPGKLLIYYTGGGACWNGQQCDTGTEPTPYAFNVNGNDPRRRGGIFNLDHPENPFKDYTIAYAPTCTGDVVLGDTVSTYHYATDGGSKKDVTVYHKGYANGTATMEWAFRNVKDPEIVVIAGSSAGAVASPFYANLAANHYTDARVIGIGDAAGSYNRPAMPDIDFRVWNSSEVYRQHPAFTGLNPQNMSAPDLYIAAYRQNLANLELYQLDHAHDDVQRYFLALAGDEKPDIPDYLNMNHRTIRNVNNTFRSYVLGGVGHTILNGDRYYFYKAADKPVNNWIQDILSGNGVGNVTCSDCSRPDMAYSETDLAIIQNIREMLDGGENWSRHDNFREDRRCSAKSGTYSLRCAQNIALRKAGGHLSRYPAVYALWYTVRERDAGENSNLPLLVRYNNAPGRTFGDIEAVIEEVEREIRAEINN